MHYGELMKQFNLFIDHLVSLDKLAKANYLKNIHDSKNVIFNKVLKLTDHLNLDNIKNYHKRISIKHKYILNNPGRHWDYVEYQTDSELLILKDALISTDGHVLKLHKTGRVSLNFLNSNYADRYHRFYYKEKSLRTHRAVASTFLPVSKRLKNIEFNKLDVSFINPEIENIVQLSNLEWLSGNEKQRKSAGHSDYNKEEYFLFEVMVDNGFKGTKFILTKSELNQYNLNARELRKCVKGRYNTILGMNIRCIKDSKNYDVIPENLKSLLLKNPKYFNGFIKPIIGEILEGPYKGLKFSLFGFSEIMHYFQNPYIQHSTLKHNEAIVDGCLFKRVTHKEAIPLHGNLTLGITKNLKLSKLVKK